MTRPAVVERIEVTTASLPFRFSFAHALAERRTTTNVYVEIALSDGSRGFGEGVPRSYVTGESAEEAVSAVAGRVGPALLGREVSEAQPPPVVLERAVAAGGGLGGAAKCALELALLDAAGHHLGCGVRRWLGPPRTETLAYDAVIPFSGPGRMTATALAVRLLGIRRVKVKVGRELAEDLRTLSRLRRLLGSEMDLRVDANCAWTVEQALHAIERMRRFRLSVIEQPVAAGDLEGLCRLRAECEEAIAVDESLRTLDEARALVEAGACDAFNIRVSKCGGLLESMRIAAVAERAGLFCIVGAQVGESGILSAAGRHLAACIAPRYLEGSAGPLLLKEDLIHERVLPGWAGRARSFDGPGLGVNVSERRLHRRARAGRVLELRLAEEVAR
jgi:L-alanine-DL-glutamate epimerase-like enolase superfamily enzyme